MKGGLRASVLQTPPTALQRIVSVLVGNSPIAIPGQSTSRQGVRDLAGPHQLPPPPLRNCFESTGARVATIDLAASTALQLLCSARLSDWDSLFVTFVGGDDVGAVALNNCQLIPRTCSVQAACLSICLPRRGSLGSGQRCQQGRQQLETLTMCPSYLPL